MMNCPWHCIGWGGTIATGAGILALTVAAPAAAQAQEYEVSVAVFANHYVLADRSIGDLDMLESALREMPGRPIRLNHCESGSARAFKAAAHRFRARPIDMRARAADARECTDPVAVMQRVAESTKPPPLGIDDSAVERYWIDIAP